ncbi:hypothetical protein CesoFtcFv8_020379 [Champsocephalus esox]|uniref:Uncharacterized protein n=1 Tax=Champsocephalus esox TaxID=159716 RepID=A0AAN8BFR4_9TELE|nr:hypothetical protein CesoFtcFv8_020379 [Champsocephalus esox]
MSSEPVAVSASHRFAKHIQTKGLFRFSVCVPMECPVSPWVCPHGVSRVPDGKRIKQGRDRKSLKLALLHRTDASKVTDIMLNKQ